MAITEEQRERSNRLRRLIDKIFPSSGRFSALEMASEIKASRWKNFYYRKQEAAEDMVQFWCKNYPPEARYLLTGEIHPPGVDAFPTHIPVQWKGQTIGDRLVWVISEWAGSSGAHLFRYLEQRSQNTVLADDWAAVIMRMREPTLQMVQVVCEHRPHFAEWVINGKVSRFPSVDPTSAESVAAWRAQYQPKSTPFSAKEPEEAVDKSAS